MTLLNTVTALTQEIHYVDELRASIIDRFAERRVRDEKLCTEIVSELDALKSKLSLLIDAPQSVVVPPIGRPTPDNDRPKS